LGIDRPYGSFAGGLAQPGRHPRARAAIPACILPQNLTAVNLNRHPRLRRAPAEICCWPPDDDEASMIDVALRLRVAKLSRSSARSIASRRLFGHARGRVNGIRQDPIVKRLGEELDGARLSSTRTANRDGPVGRWMKNSRAATGTLSEPPWKTAIPLIPGKCTSRNETSTARSGLVAEILRRGESGDT